MTLMRVRHVHNFWDSRAQFRQNLQLLPPAPRMIGPQPLYPIVKPQLNVLPKPVTRSETVATPRMEKVTAIEREFLTHEVIQISKRHRHYSYLQKCVKRGQLRLVSTFGLIETYVPWSSSETGLDYNVPMPSNKQWRKMKQAAKALIRTEAGSVLSAAAKRQGKYGIYSERQMQHAVAS